jgi:hypothetical protein
VYAYGLLVLKPERKKHLEDLGIDGTIILKLILEKKDVRVWTEFVWRRMRGRWWTHVDTVMNFSVP